jgi:hypothetical protein
VLIVHRRQWWVIRILRLREAHRRPGNARPVLLQLREYLGEINQLMTPSRRCFASSGSG